MKLRVQLFLLASLACSLITPRLLAGTWQPLKNQPPFGTPADPGIGGATNPLLLTDGSVLVQNTGLNRNSGEIWKLTPDNTGSYLNGTWSQLASLPEGFIPLYYASAVLADGRVIFIGGEYNGKDFDYAMNNTGAIYDPVTNTWEAITGPDFFFAEPGQVEIAIAFHGIPPSNPHPVGDASSAILPDGTFMLQGSLSKQAALWDTKSFPPQWSETGKIGKFDDNYEEGWTLLPTGEVLTVNTNGNISYDPDFVPNLTGAQLYEPTTGNWRNTNGNTIVQLPAAGTLAELLNPLSGKSGEIGPQVLRPDGNVFVVGSTGNTAIYNSKTGYWQAGPQLPLGLSNGLAQITVTSPDQTKGTYFGLVGFLSPSVFSMSGNIVPTVPANADTPLNPALNPQLPGNIALIATDNFQTGTITKGNHAAAAGAIGCIFYDSTGSNLGNINGSTIIPSMIVDFATGQLFLANLQGLAGTMSNQVTPVQLVSQDTAGAVLPNGNVLFIANPIIPTYSGPVSFFEFDGAKITPQPGVPNATIVPPFSFTMLVLPTGQILLTDTTGDIELYTPEDKSFNAEWAPRICEAPKKVKAGKTYRIEGFRFNGMSQGAFFGDDAQTASNYPLVRITNNVTGHVFYCRTHDHSFMGVASDKKVCTFFDIPANIELGKSTIEVVANGIPSKKKCIDVSAA